MNGAVVGAAERDQVAGIVRAAVGPGQDVLDIEVERVPAARDLAAVLVALEHAATHCGWNRSRSNGRWRRVNLGAASGSRSSRFIQRAHVGVSVVADGRVAAGRVSAGIMAGSISIESAPAR